MVLVVSCETYTEIFHYKVMFFLKFGTMCLYSTHHVCLLGHYIKREKNSSSTLKVTGLSVAMLCMFDQ